MTFDSLNTSDGTSEAVVASKPDTLSSEQRSAITAILESTDSNSRIGESIGITAGTMFHEVTHSPKKLGDLLNVIQNTEQTKLTAITDAFNAGTLSGEAAKTQAHDTVTHYGHLALTALKDSLQAQTA